jgi:hypothetical protein
MLIYEMTTVWILWVLVYADGEWRAWNTYNTVKECEEVIQIIRHHRENVLEAYCRAIEKQ